MTILGVGIEAVEVERFGRARDRFGDRLLERLFTPAELERCMSKRRPEASLAGLFAAKAALMKALGRAVAYSRVEVGRGLRGGPVVKLAPGSAPEGVSFAVTITHDAGLAVAQVIAYRGEGGSG